MLRLFLFLATSLLLSTATAQPYPKPIQLPSKFVDGERFFIKVASVRNDTLLGFGDTGGGFTAVYPSVVQELGLTERVRQMKAGEESFEVIPFTDIVKDNRIPKVEMPVFLPGTEAVFMVAPKQIVEGEMAVFLKAEPHDLFLGQHFFMGKAWTFDYPARKVWVNTPVTKTKANEKTVQRLGFKKGKDGVKLFGHPSMKVEIDGDTLDVLFDTGATFMLSANGKKSLGTDRPTAAGSFIARSVFNRWRQKHPDWKVYEKADGETDIIQVPRIKIGRHTAGPVLFSVRPDEAWSKNMIATMDRVVVGAIGGSALKYFKVKADYNSEWIEFTKR